MGAKAILEQYKKKHPLFFTSPDAVQLREQLVRVAKGSRLKITEVELDELAGITKEKSKPERGRNSGRRSKTGGSATPDDLKAFEKS